MAICVVCVSAAAIYRLLVNRPPDPIAETVSRAEWSELISSGYAHGAADVKARVVVFADYECPFCRLFHEELSELIAESGLAVGVRVHDYPLRSHQGAVRAAAVVACLRDDLPFGVIASALYGLQDSSGRPDPLAWFGANDSSLVQRARPCVEQLEAGIFADSVRSFASRFGVTATPTVLVDRNRFRVPPTKEELRALLRSGVPE